MEPPKEIIKVLMGVFPWLDPRSDMSVSLTGQVSLMLAPGCRITLWAGQSSRKGIIDCDTQDHMPEGRVFVVGDEAEAVGVVSELLPEWKKRKEFNEQTFSLYFPDSSTHCILCSPTNQKFKAHLFPSGTQSGPWVCFKDVPHFHTRQANPEEVWRVRNRISLTIAGNL
jgi:hypothetical protein